MKEYKWLFKTIFRKNLSFVPMCLILSIISYIFQPLELIVTQQLIIHVEKKDITWIVVFVTILLLIYVLTNTQLNFAKINKEKIQYKVESLFYGLLFSSIAKSVLTELDDSEFLLKVERAKDTIKTRLTESIFTIFDTLAICISLLFTISIIYKINPIYVLLVVCVALLQNVYTIFNANDSLKMRLTIDRQNQEQRYFRKLIQNKINLKEIRSYNLFDWLENKRENNYKSIVKANMKFNNKWSIINVLWSILMISIEALSFTLYFYNLYSGRIRIDQLIVLIQSYPLVIGIISGFMSFKSTMSQNSIYINDLINLFEIKNDNMKETMKSQPNSSYIVDIKNVSYSYKKNTVLQNVNLQMNTDEIIAIVGENGSGKSTLIKIIANLISPKIGDVLYNCSSISASFQDYAKFQLSIRENIGFGDISSIYNDDIINQALLNAQCSFHLDLKDKIDTVLGKEFDENGCEISEGQWQKLAIGRAMINHSGLVIFDEPTASLDPISEINQFNNIRRIYAGKTVVLVSHRIGITRLANRIIFMEKGIIKEEGTFDELLMKRGSFYDFYQSQAKWYN